MSIAPGIPEEQTRLTIVRVFDAPRARVWKDGAARQARMARDG